MRFTEHFWIWKEQYELDFVDILIDRDIPIFIDPWAIRNSSNLFAVECYDIIWSYFEKLIEYVINKDDINALVLLGGLHEPKETHFWFARNTFSWSAVWGKLSKSILSNLKKSKAVSSGFLNDIEDTVLVVEGISKDVISDIVTNLIKLPLIKYTQEQCLLHWIPMREVPTWFYWDITSQSWIKWRENLPIINWKDKIVLVPKNIVCLELGINADKYYRIDILDFEQSRLYDSAKELWKIIKQSKRQAFPKKELKEKIPKSKDFIYNFTVRYPEVYDKFKKKREELFENLSNEAIISVKDVWEPSEAEVIESIIETLNNLSSWSSNANDYHELMIWALEVVFSNNLSNPVKEEPRHWWIKRIDISYENNDRKWFFSLLPQYDIPCKKIYFECKNYSTDITNPELDQMNGRFSQNLSRIWYVLCRNIVDKEKILERCKAYVRDSRNFIIVLDDNDIIELLNFKKEKQSDKINEFLDKKMKELIDL